MDQEQRVLAQDEYWKHRKLADDPIPAGLAGIVESIIRTLHSTARDEASLANELDALGRMDWREEYGRYAAWMRAVDAQMRDACHECGAQFPRAQLIIAQPHYRLLCYSCFSRHEQGYERECAECGHHFDARTHASSNRLLCIHCYTPERHREYYRVEDHLARARAEDVPGTLTFAEWLRTLRDFMWQCAYCGGPYEELEHFTPVLSGGGTTARNCVPTCKQCNLAKGQRAPDHPLMARVFSPEALDRVRAYLSSR